MSGDGEAQHVFHHRYGRQPKAVRYQKLKTEIRYAPYMKGQQPPKQARPMTGRQRPDSK
jgi:hypothetical protein